MTSSTWKILACLLLAACGSDDSDGAGSAGSTGNAGSAGSAGSSSGPAVAVGNCNLANYYFCIFTESTGGASTLESVKSGSASGCQQAGGVWTDTSACPTENSIGSCKEVNGIGYATTTYYSGGTLTADDCKQMCEEKGSVWSAP